MRVLITGAVGIGLLAYFGSYVACSVSGRYQASLLDGGRTGREVAVWVPRGLWSPAYYDRPYYGYYSGRGERPRGHSMTPLALFYLPLVLMDKKWWHSETPATYDARGDGAFTESHALVEPCPYHGSGCGTRRSLRSLRDAPTCFGP